MFHGKKRYFQVLLGPARAQLLDDLAEKRGMRTSAFIRDLIYTHLEQVCPPPTYRHATNRDLAE